MWVWAVMAGTFVLACVGVAWFMFPLRRVGRVNAPKAPPRTGGVKRNFRWPRQVFWNLLLVLLVAVPVSLTAWWATHNKRQLDGYDDAVVRPDRQLAALFEGEHLVPPPALPPDIFLTAELVQERPLLASADRRWEQMDPLFVQMVLRAFKAMHDEHGYDMVLLEGWRSPERQALLAAKGAQVTQAGAWQSYHQFGLAVDCAFLKDGRLVISEREAWAMQGYQLFGAVAERLGLVWGGRWKLQDYGHVEWRRPGVRLGAPPDATTQP